MLSSKPSKPAAVFKNIGGKLLLRPVPFKVSDVLTRRNPELFSPQNEEVVVDKEVLISTKTSKEVEIFLLIWSLYVVEHGLAPLRVWNIFKSDPRTAPFFKRVRREDWRSR